MLLGALAWMIHVSRAKELLQDAVFAVIKTLVLALPTRFTLPIGTIENGAVASDEVRTWLDEHGIMPLWASKKMYIKMPPLETASIPASWLIWFILRHWEKEACVKEQLFALVSQSPLSWTQGSPNRPTKPCRQ